MRIGWLALILAACGGHPPLDGPCNRAVDHVFDVLMEAPPAARPKGDEVILVAAAKKQALSRCTDEGLSQAQADCILAVHEPDWDDQLRACPAYAAKPVSWVILRPTRAERQRLLGEPSVPDGPRESRIHYRQLIALTRGMCGLPEAGAAQCWGRSSSAPFPAGAFVQIALSGDMSCGRDAAGIVKCALADARIPDRTPTDAFTDFAVDSLHGCGVRTRDKQIECWNNLDDDPLAAPSAQFTSVIVNDTGACGRTLDGAERCFGEDPPILPPSDVLAWSSDEGTCTIDRNHHLACTDTWRMGPAPTGTFDTVAISRGHGCATRTGGGTVCWGENDDGACNVPQ